MRLRNAESDVLVPGIGWGDIDAYRWSPLQRQALFDDLITQLEISDRQ